MHRLLLVEDDASYARIVTRVLERHGTEVSWTTSIRTTQLLLGRDHGPWQQAWINDRLPDGRGPDLLHALHELRPAPTTVVLTAFYSHRRALQVFQGRGLLLNKPATPSALLDLLTQLESQASDRPSREAEPGRSDSRSTFDLTLDLRGLLTPAGLGPLRAAERRLLSYLLSRAPESASSLEIARAVLGRRDHAALALVRRHVANLRSGLSSQMWLVESVVGKGYRISARALAHDEAV